jgi:hypothetical protein
MIKQTLIIFNIKTEFIVFHWSTTTTTQHNDHCLIRIKKYL